MCRRKVASSGGIIHRAELGAENSAGVARRPGARALSVIRPPQIIQHDGEEEEEINWSSLYCVTTQTMYS